jgi:UDP-N-acetylglucosamine 2-epimerase
VSACNSRRGIKEYIVHTGQHYDSGMSGVFFEELGLPAVARNLGVGSGTHGEQTGAMLKGLESAISEVHPECVLVATLIRRWQALLQGRN